MVKIGFGKLLTNDAMGRFRANEIGVLFELPDGGKYDYFIDLGTMYGELFGGITRMCRQFFLYANEVEVLHACKEGDDHGHHDGDS